MLEPGFRGHDRARLLLRGEPLPRGGARRHAPRRARPLRRGRRARSTRSRSSASSGRAVRVDVSRRLRARPRPRGDASPSSPAFEAEHGAIPRGAIVLLDTGFAERWPDRAATSATAGRGEAAAAAPPLPRPLRGGRALARRGARIAAVGIDTASIDPGPSRDFEAHRDALRARRPRLREPREPRRATPAKLLGDRAAHEDRRGERGAAPRDRRSCPSGPERRRS